MGSGGKADRLLWLKKLSVNCLGRSVSKLSSTTAAERTELPRVLLELNWGFGTAREEEGKEGMV